MLYLRVKCKVASSDKVSRGCNMETEEWLDNEIREATERIRILREYFDEDDKEIIDSDGEK